MKLYKIVDCVQLGPFVPGYLAELDTVGEWYKYVVTRSAFQRLPQEPVGYHEQHDWDSNVDRAWLIEVETSECDIQSVGKDQYRMLVETTPLSCREIVRVSQSELELEDGTVVPSLNPLLCVPYIWDSD